MAALYVNHIFCNGHNALSLMPMNSHSFVVPAYGESPYLEACIQSLLVQTVQSKVIITTSTPNAHIQAIAGKYQIPCISNQGKKGIAADWNFALDHAGTQLTTIAHQDDIYEPDFLEKVLAKTKSKTWLIAFTDYYELLDGKIRRANANLIVKKILLLPFLLNSSIGSRFLKKSVLAVGDPISCPSVTFNLQALGNFHFSENMTCALDWQAWYQLAQQKGAFVFVNQKLMQHRIHAQSETTHQLQQGIRQAEERQLFEQIWGKTLGRWISKLYSMGHQSNLKDI